MNPEDNANDSSPQTTETSLQWKLDMAMVTLDRARSDQRDRSTFGCVLGIASAVPMIVGFGMTTCSSTPLLGVAITVGAVLVFMKSTSLIQEKVAGQDDADRQICAVASQLDSDDATGLTISAYYRDQLHNQLITALPRLAVAILKVLSIVGDNRSLEVAQNITWGRRDVEIFCVSAHDSEVKKAAQDAVTLLAKRFELARRSGTLLRPADSPNKMELLRPSDSSGSTSPDRLLRAERDDLHET